MKKQTAIEWLQAEREKNDIDVSVSELWKEAKILEKQQIQMAYLAGSWTHPHPCRVIEAEIYYNSTFKK
jgi:hypothetical protein